MRVLCLLAFFFLGPIPTLASSTRVGSQKSMTGLVDFITHLLSGSTEGSAVPGATEAPVAPVASNRVKTLMSLNKMESFMEGSNLTDSLRQVMKQVEDDMIGKVIENHNATQKQLDEKSNDVITLMQEVASLYEKAVNASQEFFELQDAAVARLTDIESTQSEIDSLNQTWYPICEDVAWDNNITYRMISRTVAAETMTCNLFQDVNCSAAAATLASFKNKTRNALEEVVEDVRVYNAVKSCRDYGTALSQKQEHLETVIEEYDDNKNKASDDIPKNEAQCAYVEKQFAACGSLDEWRDLERDVNSTGNSWSEEDRKKEYQTAKQILCLLGQIDESGLNQSGMNLSSADFGCDGPYKMDEDVRVTPLYKYSTETQDFVCNDTDITFSEFIWEGPVFWRTSGHKVRPTVDEYEKEEYSSLDLQEWANELDCPSAEEVEEEDCKTC